MDAPYAWPPSPSVCSVSLRSPDLETGGANAPDGADWTWVRRLLGEIDLAATPAAVRPARTYVRELVGECLAIDRSALGELELLTSEAVAASVTRSLPRGDGTVGLAVWHIDRFVRVEVTGGGPPRPGGRGLELIKALAVDFGTRHHASGAATFWFETALGDDADPAAHQAGAPW